MSPPHSLEFGAGSDNERILGLDSASVDSNMSPKQVSNYNASLLLQETTTSQTGIEI